jgi:hypothetical protein
MPSDASIANSGGNDQDMVKAKAPTEPLKETATRSRIPTFRTIEEAAVFWDTHDSADFEAEWEDVDEDIRFVVTRPGEGVLPLVLTEEMLTAISQRARQEGVAAQTLIRRWLEERLRAT